MDSNQIETEVIMNGKPQIKKLYKNQSRPDDHAENMVMVRGTLKNQCPYKNCLKVFKHSTSLVHHIKTHTGERPFVCRFCGKTFITNGNKKDHERRHLNLKLYKCKDCGEKFHRSNQLKTHTQSKNCKQGTINTDYSSHMGADEKRQRTK